MLKDTPSLPPPQPEKGFFVLEAQPQATGDPVDSYFGATDPETRIVVMLFSGGAKPWAFALYNGL